MRIVAEVVKLSNELLVPRLYCVGDDGEEERSSTDTLLDLVTESWPHEASLSDLLTRAETGTYTPANPALPDWGVNDKNVWVVPPMAKKGKRADLK